MMDEADKKRLRRNRSVLVQDLEPPRILDHLIARGVFTPEMSEDITSQATTRDQTSKLLNMLERRGSCAYGHFRNTLQETGYEHLVEKLDSTPNNQVNIDEVDAAPQRQEKRSVSSNVVICKGGRKGAQHVTNNVIGDNNFAIIGGENLTINHYHK